LQGYEKAWGPDHTSTLDTVNNLGTLYADLGRLDEAEKIYQRAIQGYEKALGHDPVKTYIPALNTTQNLATLYKQMHRASKAEEMYTRTLRGLKAVFGHSSKRYQDVISALADLHDGT